MNGLYRRLLDSGVIDLCQLKAHSCSEMFSANCQYIHHVAGTQMTLILFVGRAIGIHPAVHAIQEVTKMPSPLSGFSNWRIGGFGDDVTIDTNHVFGGAHRD